LMIGFAGFSKRMFCVWYAKPRRTIHSTTTGVSNIWFNAFMDTVKTHEASTRLREAAERGQLKHWTQALTGIEID